MWYCADLRKQECLSVLGRQIYTGHFPLSLYMPLSTYCKLVCLQYQGLHYCGALIRFPVYAVCYGKKLHYFGAMPLMLGGMPMGLRRENKHHGGHGCRHQQYTHIRVTERTVVWNAPSVDLYLSSVLFLFSDNPSSSGAISSQIYNLIKPALVNVLAC